MRHGKRLRESGADSRAIKVLTGDQIRAAIAQDSDSAPIPVFDTAGLVPVVDARRLRDRLGLSQEAFAARYRIPIGTLRDWEQRRKFPDAPARAYLTVIARDPGVVARLLGGAA